MLRQNLARGGKAMETKKCEVCDQEIGSSETVCPKCGTDFATLEEQVKSADTVLSVLEKRRKAKAKPAPAPEPAPATEKHPSIFRALGGK
jgi:hypothetical protein